MDPVVYGRFNGLGIFVGYLSLLPMGVMNGLARDLPYEMGRGNMDLVYDYVKTSWITSIIIGCGAFSVVCYFLVRSIILKDSLAIFAYACYAVTALFQIANKVFLPILYRTANDFKRLSALILIQSAASLLLVSIVYTSNYKGLSIRYIAMYLLEFFLLFRFKSIPFKGKFKLPALKPLFKTGFPIYVVGQISPLWITLQSSLIFAWGGSKAFGLYTIVIMTNTFLSLIPLSLSQMIYPQMSIAYGEGSSKMGIIKIGVRAAKNALFLSIIFGVIAWFALPYVLKLALPKYVGATRAAQFAILAPLLTNVGVLNNYFNVVKKQIPYFFTILTGVICSLLFLYIFYRAKGFQLYIFPIANFLGILIQYTCGFIYMYKDARRDK